MDELCPKDHVFDGLFALHTQESLGVSPAESLNITSTNQFVHETLFSHRLAHMNTIDCT